jgi:predicted O-methyltransferase YrrM
MGDRQNFRRLLPWGKSVGTKNDMDKPDAGDKPMMSGSHTLRRINRIAQHMGARSYLEIGVARGKTFNNLEFDRKVAVDPKFNFDVAEFQKEGVEFHALPSDRYFTECNGSEKFDIIFLDGLHRFQQTFRDFCNSLACAHDRTVILIDDIYPIDVYSALPLQRDAYEFRRRAGTESPAWHGDVFKVVFAIHDFFPMFSYVTLKGGNPQTLLWKAPREDFSPVFDSLEAVERLSYFDFLKHEAVLNLQPEKDGFNTFYASMPGSSQHI